MSRPPVVAKEIQISHNGTIFTIQVTLVETEYNVMIILFNWPVNLA